MIALQLCQIIVQKLGEFQAILGLGPIGKHHGNGTNHLYLSIKLRVLLHALFGIPTIGFDVAEKLPALHHIGCAVFFVHKVDEISVTEFLCKFGQVLGDDMRVHINL